MRLFPQALRTQPNNPDALTRKGDSVGMRGDDSIALDTLRCAGTGQILRALNRDKEAVETETGVGTKNQKYPRKSSIANWTRI